VLAVPRRLTREVVTTTSERLPGGASAVLEASAPELDSGAAAVRAALI